MPDNLSVGERMRARREALGLSGEDVGSKLGVNKSTIYRYEKGEIEKMPITVVKKLAKVLKTSPDYLMGWDSRNSEYIMEDIIWAYSKFNQGTQLIKLELTNYDLFDTQEEVFQSFYDDEGNLELQKSYIHSYSFCLDFILSILVDEILTTRNITFDVVFLMGEPEFDFPDDMDRDFTQEKPLPLDIEVYFENRDDYDLILDYFSRIAVKTTEALDLMCGFLENSFKYERFLETYMVDPSSLYLNRHNLKVNKSPLIPLNNEDNLTVFYAEGTSVSVVEKLSAGAGFAYGDNQKTTYYTRRTDLKPYDLASLVYGDSMEPRFKNGDVVLIRSGYDSTNGDVYAVDYQGESYIKRVFLEGDRIRLTSYNDSYDDIMIYLPIDQSNYFNIIGKVVDSFTPVNKED